MQRPEPVLPQRSIPVQPLVHLDERLRPQADQLAAAVATTKDEIGDTGIGPHLDAVDLDDLEHLLQRLRDGSKPPG